MATQMIRGGRSNNRSRMNTPGGVISKNPLQTTVVQTNRATAGSQLGSLGGASTVQFIEHQLTNGGGTDLTYIIGDPYGSVAAITGATYTPPTSTPNGSVASVKAQFATRPVGIIRMNMVLNAASPNVAQFNQATRYLRVDQNGDLHSYRLPIAPFQSSADQDRNVRTTDLRGFKIPIVIDDSAGITQTVLAGQAMYLALEVGDSVIR